LGKLIHISEISRQSITCKNCGKEVVFGENQWRVRCGSCGISVTIPKNSVIRTKQAGSRPECFICQDAGIIHYKAQEQGEVYQFVAKCICKAGESKAETYPAVYEVAEHMPDISWLAQKNRDEWNKRHGEKTLFDGAEQVDAVDVPFNA